MVKRLSAVAAIAMLTAIYFTTPAGAQWAPGYGAIVHAQNNPIIEYDLVADGAGGVIVAYEDSTAGNTDIYAQRLDDHGYPMWGAGVPLCRNGYEQTLPKIAEDGLGGAIVIWQDARDGQQGIYGQRIAANGTVLWAADGVPIAWSAGTQANGEIAYDGYGGAVVVWEQYVLPYYQIRAQRVGINGSLLWGGVVAVASNAAHMRFPELVVIPGADEANTRVTVAWIDYRDSGSNGSDIYAQRLTLGGVVQWASDGLVVYAGAGNQSYPDLVASNSGGTIFSWRDFRNDEDRGYCQKLDRYGARQWSSSGVSLYASHAQDVAGPAMVSDGNYGVFVTSGSYVYQIDSGGTMLWGRLLYMGPPDYGCNARPVRLDDGDCLVVFQRYAEFPSPMEIMVQRIDLATGYTTWEPYGLSITDNVLAATPVTILDSDGGVMMAWVHANWGWFLSVQRLDPDLGYWGYPVPVIADVADVPDDEGGWLTMNVRATTNDQAYVPDEAATGYNVWRRVDGPAAMPASAAEFRTAVAEGGETGGLVVAGDQAKLLGLSADAWESLGFHAAMQEPYYDLVVPTRTDAVDGSQPWEVYRVTAHTEVPWLHFTSEPDSAWSVDNLAPGLLQGLAGTAAYAPEGLQLSWLDAPESDLSRYDVHRGLAPGFEPDETNRVASTGAAGWFDPDWSEASGFHYRVAAVDRHGNVGAFASLAPGDLTEVVPGAAPRATALRGNHPNPFNPATTILFDLARDGRVRLGVYDVEGRLVRRLIEDEMVPAGRRAAFWDGRDDRGGRLPSGVYFCRLQAGGRVDTGRMTLVR